MKKISLLLILILLLIIPNAVYAYEKIDVLSVPSTTMNKHEFMTITANKDSSFVTEWKSSNPSVIGIKSKEIGVGQGGRYQAWEKTATLEAKGVGTSKISCELSVSEGLTRKTYVSEITITVKDQTNKPSSSSSSSSEYDVSSWAPNIETENSTELSGKVKTILGIIRAIGSIIAVVALMIIGIKYMFGSTEEKAEYKKTMLPYVIGAILLFACSNLVQILYKFGNGL